MVEKNIKTKKNKKTYSTPTRLLCYDRIVLQVATGTTPKLLKSITKRTGFTINPVPKRTTIEQMTRELGLLCEQQAAETLLENEDCTLAFDTTTQDG